MRSRFFEPPERWASRDVGHRSGGRQRDLCGDRQALAQDADRQRHVEAAGVNPNPVAMWIDRVPNGLDAFRRSSPQSGYKFGGIP